MREMTDAAEVREQYRTEAPLETRRSVWQPAADGRDPVGVAADAVRAAGPGRVLEVGCGTGLFAQRAAAENPGVRVIATDLSERFVALTRDRGVAAEVADVQRLPFGDGAFDVVAAMWMLYHVPDLDRALAEVRRVLRPGGTFVAATNGEGHLADLLAEAGGSPLVTGFSSENGAAALTRHFSHVAREDLATRALFADHAAAAAYLSTFDDQLAAGLPCFEGSREYAGATTVFVAR